MKKKSFRFSHSLFGSTGGALSSKSESESESSEELTGFMGEGMGCFFLRSLAGRGKAK